MNTTCSSSSHATTESHLHLYTDTRDVVSGSMFSTLAAGGIISEGNLLVGVVVMLVINCYYLLITQQRAHSKVEHSLVQGSKRMLEKFRSKRNAENTLDSADTGKDKQCLGTGVQCLGNDTPSGMCQPAQIFLGGTCASSTWRTEQAIPIIEQANCTYFNPQLPEGAWTPEAIPLENQAKADAACLLYVITSEARGIASMVEAAELIAASRKLVLCMTDYSKREGGLVRTKSLLESDNDVNRGRKYLRDVAARYDCPVYDNIEKAAMTAVKFVTKPRQMNQVCPLGTTQVLNSKKFLPPSLIGPSLTDLRPRKFSTPAVSA